jgi:hypothetical protein
MVRAGYTTEGTRVDRGGAVGVCLGCGPRVVQTAYLWEWLAGLQHGTSCEDSLPVGCPQPGDVGFKISPEHPAAASIKPFWIREELIRIHQVLRRDWIAQMTAIAIEIKSSSSGMIGIIQGPMAIHSFMRKMRGCVL